MFLGRGRAFLVTACLAASAHAQCPRWDREIGVLGPGGGGQAIHALALYGGPELYAGGEFTEMGGYVASNIARWDGHRWRPVGAGVGGAVYALTVYDDGSGPALFAAGDFLSAGGIPALRIARWDGATWSPLGEPGSGLAFNYADQLVVYDDGRGPALYVGGRFHAAGALPGTRAIARWGGTRWESVGGGVENGEVGAMVVLSDSAGTGLLVYGPNRVGGVNTESRIARWNGTAWRAWGPEGVDAYLMAVVDTDGAGPEFGRLYAADPYGVGIWHVQESTRTLIGPALQGQSNGHVHGLCAVDEPIGPGLIAVGEFTSIAGVPVSNIARYSGGWRPLREGLYGGQDGLALGVADGPLAGLYVAGNFQRAGCEHPGYLTNRIAFWGCPHGCYPDCDGSAVLDIFDFLCFQNSFSAADAFADCNQDCTMDVFDFLCFQNAFAAGCP